MHVCSLIQRQWGRGRGNLDEVIKIFSRFRNTNRNGLFVALALAVSLGIAGCSKSGVDTTALEKAFQAPPAAAQGQPPDQVQQVMHQALAAIKKDNYVEGAQALQVLRAHPQLTTDQLTSVQDAMAALQQQLVRRADAGDLRAKQTLEALKTMRR